MGTILKKTLRVRPVTGVFAAAMLVWAVSLGCGTGQTKAQNQEDVERIDGAPSAEEKSAPKNRIFLYQGTHGEYPGKSLFLLGSIHVASEDFYPLDPAIEDAYAAAEALVVEMNVTDQDKMTAALMKMGTLPKGTTLEDTLSPESWVKLVAASAESGLNLGALQSMKSWVVAMTFYMLHIARLGLNPGLGIDLHFLSLASKNKEILELERAEEQFAIFNEMSPALQELMLMDAVEGISLKDGTQILAMAAAWKSGDATKLHELMTEHLVEQPEYAPLHERLFTKRNIKMAARISKLFEKKSKLFVVVGAGHLVGDGSVVDLLEDQGWTIEQQSKTASYFVEGEGQKDLAESTTRQAQ